MAFWIFVIIGALALIALWRSNWNWSDAWASLAALGTSILGAVVSWFHGGGSTP